MRKDTRDTPEANGWVLVFTDESDRAWEVHEIRDPILEGRPNRYLRGEYSAGWLLFMSGEERRRLAPYPPGWRFADAARLRCWVNDALPVPTRNTSMPGDGARVSPSVNRSSQSSV